MNEAFNRQGWLDPFIIICSLPGAFCGIVWALFLTQTTLQRSKLDGRDHVDRRGNCKFNSSCDVRK